MKKRFLYEYLQVIPFGALVTYKLKSKTDKSFDSHTYNKLFSPYSQTIFDKEQFKQLSLKYQMILMADVAEFINVPIKISSHRFLEDKELGNIFINGLKRMFENPIDSKKENLAIVFAYHLHLLCQDQYSVDLLVKNHPEIVKLTTQAFFRQVEANKKEKTVSSQIIAKDLITDFLLNSLSKFECNFKANRILKNIGYYSKNRKEIVQQERLRRYKKHFKSILKYSTILSITTTLIHKLFHRKNSFKKLFLEHSAMNLTASLIPYSIVEMSPKIYSLFDTKSKLHKNWDSILFFGQLSSIASIACLMNQKLAATKICVLALLYYLLYRQSDKNTLPVLTKFLYVIDED